MAEHAIQSLENMALNGDTSIPSPALPYEIIKYALRFCNAPSLSAIASCDRQLNTDAESQLYGNLDLLGTSKHAGDNGRTVSTFVTAFLNHPLYHVLAAILAKGSRGRIRFLALQVDTDARHLLNGAQQLLEHSQDTLVDLHLQFHILKTVYGDHPWRYSPTLPNLRRLDLTGVASRHLPWFLEILTKCPNIEHLRVDTYYKADVHTFRVADRPEPPQSLPNLRTIASSHHGTDLPPLISGLLCITPNLDKLVWNYSVKMVGNQRSGSGNPPDTWHAISKSKSLRTFVWVHGTTRDFYHLVRRRGGFAALEEVVVGDRRMGGDMNKLGNIFIPELTNLKTMFIHISHPQNRSIIHNSFSLTNIPPPAKNHCKTIDSNFLYRLKYAPSFLAIRYTFKNVHDRVPHNANMWDIHNARGILIRTYTNDSDDLVLLRARSENGWTYYADCNGQDLPMEKLERLMDMIGDRMDWAEPGRGMSMPEEAWNFVKSP